MLNTKPQPGTNIRCVNDGGRYFLTKGKIYEVLDTDYPYDPGFQITDDDGDVCWVDETDPEKFELVEERVEMKNEETNSKKDEFRVGDVVWCAVHGKGKVTGVDNYYVIVDMLGSTQYYTKDGKLYTTSLRTLFFSEPKIEAAVTRPFVPTLVGKRVVVKEYFCYPQILTVCWEDEDKFGDDLYSCIKSNCEVYEVSSENLLKK